MTHHLIATAVVALSAVAVAQQPGQGLRLIGPTGSTSSHLVDVNGQIVHTWPNTFRPGLSLYIDETDGNLVRTIRTPGQAIAGGIGGGIQKLALDGTVLWDFRYDTNGDRLHHDIAIMPNGNILAIAWEEFTFEQIVAMGRDPSITRPNGAFRPDHVIEIRPTGPTTGQIVWEWHVTDHLIQDFDPSLPNFGQVDNHPELVDINFPGFTPSNGDWNHSNSLAYDPVHDWVIISARRQHEIWIIDHSTTTQEAAGHTGGRWGKGGDLLYRWGNPRAYGAGTAIQQQLFGQHSANIIPEGYPGAGNLTIFNNNVGGPGGASQAFELVLPLDPAGNFTLAPSGMYGPVAPVWSYTSTVFSPTQSSAVRLRNGNTLLTHATFRFMEEVSPAGQVVWSYTTPGVIFHGHYVERSLWADEQEISISAGGTINFDLIAGSQHNGGDYIVLGSASGTSPGIQLSGLDLPLNVDGYFLTTLSLPNVFPFTNTAGTLDAFGRATASFTMPGGILPPQAVGLEFHHAFVILDTSNGVVEHTSNAVPLRFNP